MKIYNSLVERLRSQHESISYIISKSEWKLYLQPQPGKWSIHDNITHLTKYQPVFLERVNKILESDEPVFERYTAEMDPDFETWRKWETSRLLETMNEDRRKIFQRITSMNNTELNLKGTHKKFGTITILEWTEFFLLHEAHHIFTIFQLANKTN